MSLESQSGHGGGFEATIAEAMARELHKTAQPLMILQGLLEFMVLQANGECGSCGESEEGLRSSGCTECKGLLERAGEELPRLANCFDEVRKLVGLQRAARDVKTFALAPLVSDVLRELSGDLYAAGVTGVVDVRPHEEPMNVAVEASVSRVATGIRSVVMALAERLGAGDEIENLDRKRRRERHDQVSSRAVFATG